MGVCLSKDSSAANSLANDAEIERKNREHAEKEQGKIKLLLLGAGESGKSTIFKQMRILYGMGYSEEERRSMLPALFANVIGSMKTLIAAAKELGLLFAEGSHAAQVAAEFTRLSDERAVDGGIAGMVSALWASPPIQAAFASRSRFQVPDSCSYFFDRIEAIGRAGYIPSPEDVLKVRVRTSGILSEEYVIDGVPFEVYDVGGQKNERRKWIHAFDDVTAIIFVAALSEFDQVMFEDASVNRMQDALRLFEDVCNSRYFENTSIILFLNKRDVFEAKIKAGVTLAQPNPDPFGAEKEPMLNADYTGGQDVEAATRYIVNKFLARNKKASKGKEVFWRATCATDSDNVAAVFAASKEIILKQNLMNSGFMEDRPPSAATTTTAAAAGGAGGGGGASGGAGGAGSGAGGGGVGSASVAVSAH